MTSEKLVVLLNPSGKKNYIRDYYCSKTSKSDYSYTPVDFLYIGAYLKSSCKLQYIDCIIDNISPDRLLERLSELRPDIVVTLTGYVSWREDFALFGKIKAALPSTRLVGSGDILLGSNLELLFGNSFLDAILYDFSSSEIIDYCSGVKREFEDISYKDEDNNIVRNISNPRKKVEEISIGIPPHDIFPLAKYEYSFIRRKPFATVLTDYSCPYRCTFCIMSTLGYKYRSVADIIGELDYLKERGIKEIYFADQTFGANKKNTRNLLEQMREKDYRFSWVCFSRADTINQSNIGLMKATGCHTIIFGVEFGNDDNLEATKKDLVTSQIDSAIDLCREHGIRTVGTFMLGEATHTVDDLRDIVDYSTSLELDFASFNVYVPRVDDYLKSLGDLDAVDCYDQSGAEVKSFSPKISDDVLATYHRLARRRFYLRPGYILRRLAMVKTFVELKILARESFYLLRGIYSI